MFNIFRSRVFLSILAFFGVANWADGHIDPNWHWHDIVRQPFNEWVKQVPVQLPLKLAHGLQIPVDVAVARLSQNEMPWYVRLPAKAFGAAVLYALLMRLLIWRLRARFGWAPREEQLRR
jgi:hypothetical protein